LGLLDSGKSQVTDGMLLAAADTIAAAVPERALSAAYVIPKIFESVASGVALAVSRETGLSGSDDGATLDHASG
jgi:malate dehydrogenase (oxaloacetate-decarboxylating)